MDIVNDAPWSFNKAPKSIEPILPSDVPRCCVFCGERANNNTPEHILPLWLLNDYSSKLQEPVIYSHELGKVLRCRTTPFPACRKCNSNYSQLEQEAKYALHSLIKKQQLSLDSASTLLDWFDKMRIGVSLAGLKLMGKGSCLSPPNVISSRVGRTDRMLYILRKNPTGTIHSKDFDDFASRVHPSFYYIAIDNHFFLSVSEPGIAANTLGITKFIRTSRERSGERVEYRSSPSRSTLEKPIFDIRPNGATVIVQSILPYMHIDSDDKLKMDDNKLLRPPMYLYSNGRMRLVTKQIMRVQTTKYSDNQLQRWLDQAMKQVLQCSLNHLHARDEWTARLQDFYRVMVNHGSKQAMNYLGSKGGWSYLGWQ